MRPAVTNTTTEGTSSARCSSVPVLLLGLTVLTTNILVPTLVGTYVDSFGLSLQQAGYTAAIYMLGGGIGGVLVSQVLGIAPTRTVLAVGLGALAIGNFISIYVSSFSLILAIRLIAGVGEGIGFGLMGAYVSRLANPNRIYAVFTFLLLLISAAIQYLLPILRNDFGPRMLLVPIAVAPACLLAILRSFSDLSNNARSLRSGAAQSSASPLAPCLRIVPIAVFVIYVAYGGQFAYFERLGVFAGFTPNAVARLLGSAYLVALAGAALAFVLTGTRTLGLKLSLALAVVVVSAWLIVAGQPTMYRVGIMVIFCAWSFFLPNLLGVVSLVDRNGRLAAASLGAMEWGMAAGPAIVGVLVSNRNLVVVASIATPAFIFGLLLLVPALRSLSRDQKLSHNSEGSQQASIA
jgi:predicted MFS family arabinose efflux permease